MSAAIYFPGKYESGVESILDSNEQNVRYFNLQGVEIANPETGVFIRVEGNKTNKIIR